MRVCSTCHGASENFRKALLSGSEEGAMAAYSTGCVNLRAPYTVYHSEVSAGLRVWFGVAHAKLKHCTSRAQAQHKHKHKHKHKHSTSAAQGQHKHSAGTAQAQRKHKDSSAKRSTA